MCRALMYLGEPLTLFDVLYQTDSSLIKQSYNPKYMSNFLNLAGFGMAAWSKHSLNPQHPFLYKTNEPPFFDINLKNLSSKLLAECLIAHVRGTIYSEKAIITKQNVHPFMFEGCKLTLAHNGDLHDFNKMKYKLINWIKPDIAEKIRGTTDSEWMYALMLSFLENPYAQCSIEEVERAVAKMISVLREVRAECNITQASPVNLFITNGEYLIATRFILDFGCFFQHYTDDSLTYQSLWYTFGAKYGYSEGEYKMIGDEKNSSIIISSEPLTNDVTTWIEAPEYSIMSAYIHEGEVKIGIKDIEEVSISVR